LYGISAALDQYKYAINGEPKSLPHRWKYLILLLQLLPKKALDCQEQDAVFKQMETFFAHLYFISGYALRTTGKITFLEKRGICHLPMVMSSLN